MSLLSYLYSNRVQCDPTQIYLVVVPEWMEVTLKSQGLTLDRAWDLHNQSQFSSIFSDQDVVFHDNVTMLVGELLFGSHTYVADKKAREEQLKLIIDAWFAMPFSTNTTLNLHPVILASNVIALVNYKGDDVEEVCQTNIYERLLQRIHHLIVSQVGTKAWDTPLVRDVLSRLQLFRKAA